jgi:hypothetical protein
MATANLLLIDNRITDINGIISSLAESTDHVIFNYYEDTFESIKGRIKRQYLNVALAQHNYNGSNFKMLNSMPGAMLEGVRDSDPELNTWNVSSTILKNGVMEESMGFLDFLRWLKENGAEYVDFLACDVWASAHWKYVIEKIRKEVDVWIRASVDITGYSGNFILESDGVDLVGVYFTQKILQYKYSFIGSDFVDLINTKSPWGVYSASKYDSVNNILPEIRGNGRNATVSNATGTSKLIAGKSAGNGATGEIRYLNGNTDNIVRWPNNSIVGNAVNSIAFITRYTNTTNRQRILSSRSASPNLALGHGSGSAGVVYINPNYKTTYPQSLIPTENRSNWVNMVVRFGSVYTSITDNSHNILLNGLPCAITDMSYVAANTSLVINDFFSSTSNTVVAQSDFGFSYLMIWQNVQLTNAEMVIVSNQLKFYLDSGFEPPVPTPFQNLLSSRVPWGIYRAVDWNSTTNKLPEARGITGRDAIKGVTGTVTYTASTAGNGANGSITCISGNTLTELIWPDGSIPTTYTLAFITRYTGENYKRILQGTTNNLIFGHYSDGGGTLRGVYYNNGTWFNNMSYGTITDWLTMICKVDVNPNNCIVDGIARGINSSSTPLTSADKLQINNGNVPGDDSAWAFSYLMIWEETLSFTDASAVSNELLSYTSTGTLPETNGYVRNGYFTTPAVALTSYLLYDINTAPNAIKNWSFEGQVDYYIFGINSTFNSIVPITNKPPGAISCMAIIQSSTPTESRIYQQIMFDQIGPYSLTYYTSSGKNDDTVNLCKLKASIDEISHESLINNQSWEKRELIFNLTTTGSKTLYFLNTRANQSTTPSTTFLAAINITPIQSVPYPPTITSATPSSNQITVNFNPPISNGRSPITSYSYRFKLSSTLNYPSTYTSLASNASSFAITSLTAGATYDIELVATNALGNSSPSQTTVSTATAPSSPTLNSVSTDNGTITIRFSPNNDGGSPIIGYRYKLNTDPFIDIGAPTGITPYTYTISTGLLLYSSYSIVVDASNIIGYSSPSNSLSITVIPRYPAIVRAIKNNLYSVIIFNDGLYTGQTISSYSYTMNSTSTPSYTIKKINTIDGSQNKYFILNNLELSGGGPQNINLASTYSNNETYSSPSYTILQTYTVTDNITNRLAVFTSDNILNYLLNTNTNGSYPLIKHKYFFLDNNWVDISAVQNLNSGSKTNIPLSYITDAYVDNQTYKKGTGSLRLNMPIGGSMTEYLKASSFNLNSTACTFAFWIKSTDLPSNEGDIINLVMFATMNNGLNSYINVYLKKQSTTNTVCVSIKKSNVVYDYMFSGYDIAGIFDGQWAHICLTMQSTGGTYNLYINTVLVSSVSGAVYPDSGIVYKNPTSGFITATENGNNISRVFNGYVDDFRFYNGKVLTIEEINSMYVSDIQQVGLDPGLAIHEIFDSYYFVQSTLLTFNNKTTGINYNLHIKSNSNDIPDTIYK